MDEAARKQIGEYWSGVVQKTNPTGLKLRWWQSPFIVRHINMRVCGQAVDGLSRGLVRRAKELLGERAPLTRGVSVGCGNATKELDLIKQGLVETFDLCEFSETRIAEARARAEKLGLADRVRFIHGDAFALITEAEQYDLVHWNNSLHHMFDVDEAVKWSRHVLRAGGLFFMDDFVGPTRFQWSELALNIASHVRLMLDQRFLRDPRQTDRLLNTDIRRPNPEKLRAVDPSEAADSGRIVESIRRYFPAAELMATGGIVYNLALSDVLHNFDEEQDKTVLELLMFIDDLCADLVETLYATALAFKE